MSTAPTVEEMQDKFEDVKADAKKAVRKATELAMKPFQVELSRLAWEAYEAGATKDSIHRANRDYANTDRRRELWAYFTPENPVADLRSRGKQAREKADRGYEWLEDHEVIGTFSEDYRKDYVDAIKFDMGGGVYWTFGIVHDSVNNLPSFDNLDGMETKEWWPEYARLMRMVREEYRARATAREQEDI